MNLFPKKAIAGAAIGLATLGLFSFKTESERYFDIAKNLDIFATLFKEVNTYYVDEITPSKLVKTGIDAMLKSLDPYTNYIPEDDIEDFRTMTTGQYGGIGAIIGKRNNKVIVEEPYEGFPAHKAGLLIGDEILKIDGVDVGAKNTADVSKLVIMRSRVNLTTITTHEFDLIIRDLIRIFPCGSVFKINFTGTGR